MAKNIGKRLKISAFTVAFFILAFVFLAVILGTAGTARTLGDSYELVQGAEIVFHLVPERDDDGQVKQKDVKRILVNFGNLYNEIGDTAEFSIQRTSSGSAASAYWSDAGGVLGSVTVDNVFSKQKNSLHDSYFQWIEPFDLSDEDFMATISSYSRYQLKAKTCNMTINEVVFIGDDGNPIPVEIDKQFSANIDAEAATAAIDAQSVPVSSQSAFFRYSDEEMYSLMTVTEIRAGNKYYEGNAYHIDRTYNALGLDIVALGTSIFGVSPFGLRFFPALASFGILVVGWAFVKNLLKSEKAAFVFAVLYALSGFSVIIAHLGTPLSIGLFFFLTSLYACHKFYDRGMKHANFLGALPLLASGLAGGAAICVHSAYLIPVAGVAALFVLGMLRQQKAKKFYLSKAAETLTVQEETETVGEERAAVAPAAKTGNRAAKIKEEFRFKNLSAPIVFGLSLIVGALLIGLFAFLPAYSAFIKAYDDPAQPTMNMLSLMWKGFLGCFTGGNLYTGRHTVWDLGYLYFRGTGETYGVLTSAPNVAAMVFGAAGLILSVLSALMILVKNGWGKRSRAAVRQTAIPLIGAALSLLTMLCFGPAQPVFESDGATVLGYLVSGAGYAFLAAAILFSFVAAAQMIRLMFEFAASRKGRHARTAKAICIAITAVLGVIAAGVFAVSVPFLFSIPVPASWIAAIFG